MPIVIVLTLFDGLIVGLEQAFYAYVSDFIGFGRVLGLGIFLVVYIFVVSAILDRIFHVFRDFFQRTDQ